MKKLKLIFCFINLFCFNSWAEKYELSDDQQKFLIMILSNAQIRGADAPMLLQCAQSLQRPIPEKVEPKSEAPK